jgi:hypothetical protein
MSGRGAGARPIAWFETSGVAALLTTRAEPDLIQRSAPRARLEG